MTEILRSTKRNLSRDLSKNIIDLLKTAEGMMTIQEIAASTSINRITAAKYLAILEARGTVKCRNIGRAKLYSMPEETKL